jgi:hypothetical protein
LGGDENDLRQLGFLDSDDEIDFSNFASKKEETDESEQTTSLFGKLTNAFKNFTGNKVLTK